MSTANEIESTIQELDRRIHHLRRRWCFESIDSAIYDAGRIEALANALQWSMRRLRIEEEAS